MWSGAFAPRSSPRRLQIACRTDSFDYELQIGFPENCLSDAIHARSYR